MPARPEFASWPDLIQPSIPFQKSLAKKIDNQAKPGDDGIIGS
jgi:hypothetical protein